MLLVTCRRKAIAPFIFSDGFKVAVGDWLCIPQQAMMLDSHNYNNPQTFDGFRFVTEISRDNKQSYSEHKTSSRFTDASSTWLIWGSGKTVW